MQVKKLLILILLNKKKKLICVNVLFIKQKSSKTHDSSLPFSLILTRSLLYTYSYIFLKTLYNESLKKLNIRGLSI